MSKIDKSKEKAQLFRNAILLCISALFAVIGFAMTHFERWFILDFVAIASIGLCALGAFALGIALSILIMLYSKELDKIKDDE